MKSVIRKFYDSIKCPICGFPIDSSGECVTNWFGINCNHCCSREFDHYRLNIRSEKYIDGTLTEFPVLISDEVTARDKYNVYVISKTYDNNALFKTRILVNKIDGEKRIIEGEKLKSFYSFDDLFDFNKFDPKKAIQRIKTIFVFQ